MHRSHLAIASAAPDGTPLSRRPVSEFKGMSWVLGAGPLHGSTQFVSSRLLCARATLLVPPRLVIASSLVTPNASRRVGPQATFGSDVHNAPFYSDKEMTRHG